MRSSASDLTAMRTAIRDLDVLQVAAIFHAEVTSALRSLALARKIDPARALVAAHQVRDVRRLDHPFSPFIERVWELHDNISVYDASYVAVAEQLEEPLVTADARLARAPSLRCDVIVTAA